MKFGPAPLDEARGAILAHSQRVGEKMIRKGSLLDDAAISALREAGRTEVICARLEPGDILVTRATDPGWTPVFSTISGLVLEIGGQLSHGAIVAREYGLPEVINVTGATRQIQDGETITVDGSAGTVRQISESGAVR